MSDEEKTKVAKAGRRKKTKRRGDTKIRKKNKESKTNPKKEKEKKKLLSEKGKTGYTIEAKAQRKRRQGDKDNKYN